MLKIIVRILIILGLAGLVAGGMYLWVQPGGGSLAGAAGPAGGFSHGPANAAGSSLAGLGGLALQVAKIAGITALILVVRAISQVFKRRDKQARIVTG